MHQLHIYQRQSFRISSATLSAIILFSFQITGCKKDITKEEDQLSLASNQNEKKIQKAEMVVRPGQSIQAAVDAAAPNSVIRILPGLYKEAVVVDKPGMEIIGSDGVVIQNPVIKTTASRSGEMAMVLF